MRSYLKGGFVIAVSAEVKSTYFDQQSQIHILRFYFSTPDFSVVFMVDVDTLKYVKEHILISL